MPPQGGATTSGAIVLGGLAGDVVARLMEVLVATPVVAARTGAEVVERVLNSDPRALVMDHDLSRPQALRTLRELRGTPAGSTLPVLYCLHPSLRAQLAEELVGELRVDRLLFHPLEADEVARQVADVAGLPVPDLEDKAQRRARTAQAVSLIWEKSRERVMTQVDLLEEATTSLLIGELDSPTRKRARAEAHKLAGSVGTFGFADGSRLAREVETIFSSSDLREEGALRLSELVLELRSELQKPLQLQTAVEPMTEPLGRGPVLLVVSRDPQLTSRLVAEAATKNMKTVTANGMSQARALAARVQPVVALLDLALGDQRDEEFAFVEELAASSPPCLPLVFTSSREFTDRVEVARRGGRGFVDRSVAPDRVMEVVGRLLTNDRMAHHKVLGVDDDPLVLDTLQAILGPGIDFTPVEDPRRFWRQLEDVSPDLIILDIDMPGFSGLELCRAVRNDPMWADLPILFLTAHHDAETVHAVYAAGADDYLAKPIIGPEVVTRIKNRLERVSLYRSVAESDTLTGVANRRKSSQVLNGYLRLAERYLQPLAVAVIDLDDLKRINRFHGHGAGDRVLRKFGELVAKVLRGEDVIARWGGKEFVVGMYGMSREDGVLRVAELLEAVRMIDFPGADSVPFNVSFSAGIAQYPEDGEDLHELYRSAEEAVQQAKSAGGDRVLPAGWDPKLEKKIERFDVVMVEDDPALAELLIHGLETRGYNAHWIKDGEQAAEALGGRKPRLRTKVVLLDVDLPGLDGIGVLRKLAEFSALRTTRVIMLTVRATEAEVLKTLELGAFDHVSKPFSVPVLMQRIRRAMGE